MKPQYTKRFLEKYNRLPKDIQNRVEKTLAQFFENPTHPSLRFKKMGGLKDWWEIRVTDKYRIMLMIEGDTYIFHKVGKHDILDKF